MFRIILMALILFLGTYVLADEWTASSVSVPTQYAYPSCNCPNYYNNPYVSTYYNPLGTNQNYYQSYGSNPYQYSYGNSGYNPYYGYAPTTLSNIGGNSVGGQVLRNIGRNVLYSFMRGY